jgi:predicted transposase/invertase (TIGR01784 family)
MGDITNIDDEELQQSLYEKYKKLTFADDFVFCKVLKNNKGLCKDVLEIILGKKVNDIVFTETQKSFKETLYGKGIRMDVYIEGEDTVYDIEMQRANRDIPKRMRYYHSVSDLAAIRPGQSYSDLRNVYIIFICTFDPFSKGLPFYTFRNICREDPSLELDDGTTRILINADWDATNLAGCFIPCDRWVSFIKYVKSGEATDDLTKKLETAVKDVLANPKWRQDYMMMEMELLERERKGREEGREEGREQGRDGVILDALKNNHSCLKVANFLNADLKLVIEVAKKNGLPTED